MDGLKNGQLFDDMFQEDGDGGKLNQLPQIIETFDLYRSKYVTRLHFDSQIGSAR